MIKEEKTLNESMNLVGLIDSMFSQIRNYGILEISMEQYQVVGNQILNFATLKGVDAYSGKMADEYLKIVEERCTKGEICAEYLRLQKRFLRMLSSLVNTGKVDFTLPHNHKKYIVSYENSCLVQQILDDNRLIGESRKEMDTVIRHIFFYAESKGLKLVDVSDELFMEFLTTEMPATNKGSIGRTMRGIRYVSSYLKTNHLSNLSLDFSQLKIKTNSVKIIPPYTQEEISQMLSAIDRSTLEGIP